jgi:c-di-GMP-binding flagellar brake protein YcgR
VSKVVELPAVNQRIWLQPCDSSGSLSSRIENIDERHIAIALPSDGRTTVTLASGRELDAFWTRPRGLGGVRAMVVARSDAERVPTLTLEMLTQPAIYQRRHFVRVETAIAVSLTLDQHRSVEAISNDVSGGGMSIRASVDAGVGARIHVSLQIPGGDAIDAVGRILRKERDTTSIEFLEIAEPEREQIIRFLYDEQRKQLATLRTQ